MTPKNTSGTQEAHKATLYHSFLEWKERFFPGLVREDTYQALRKDTEQLAQALANDTFDRLRSRQGT